MRSMKGEGWLGVSEAALVLGVSRQAVFKMTLEGRLAYQQPKGYGGQIWILAEDVASRLEADKGAKKPTGLKGVKQCA